MANNNSPFAQWTERPSAAAPGLYATFQGYIVWAAGLLAALFVSPRIFLSRTEPATPQAGDIWVMV